MPFGVLWCPLEPQQTISTLAEGEEQAPASAETQQVPDANIDTTADDPQQGVDRVHLWGILPWHW